MKVVKRTERGWAGHFICAHYCRFRRNTLLTCGRTKVIISSVGAMYTKEESAIQTIGCERYYETMVFLAEKEGPYIDIAVTKELKFDSPWSINAKKWQDLPDDVDNKANNIHEAVVAEMTGKLGRGEKLKRIWED